MTWHSDYILFDSVGFDWEDDSILGGTNIEP
jgi:hypothetical protein